MSKREAARFVREVLSKRGVRVRSVRHVYPRAYVLAKVAAGCLVVAVPSKHDCEPQIRGCEHGYQWVREGDVSTLNAGDWCIVAYVSTSSSGQQYAINIPRA